jgi:hypothetical protein
MSATLNNICELLKEPEYILEYKHVLEFGMWKGDSIMGMRKLLPDKYKIYGFDSFLGLPEDWPETQYKKGDFAVDASIKNNLKKIKKIKIFEGWFKDTIPKYLKEADDIALLHVDCDLYSSTIDIFYSGLKKYIKSGTYIVFDDWEYLARWREDKENEGQHNQKAFIEWAKDFNVKYELFEPLESFRRALKILEI